ncbi:hypothetical protein EXW28_29275 (plasmid) [Bacillus mycoides]|uniref:TauD/TfdA family dioxygenase n=1 Tax=Bacillus mycoides TaxID=1405 RepID=UPI0011ED0963|nr:TauD/TfdA family dioxygenase [Bacillus mycoides]NUC20158.1 TauD/TfdA family dioxygenase [Bacillus mycoides]QEL88312.1 hypothetical protein DN409_28990 [Bacillus mycoides]QWG53824.1 hypothetical protein EXW37_29270 [Bacillus mycoides]QWG59345.1 hypothetical protein EXW26_29030 [Bacillus mycoides]QWG75940.1 hypothetical protein EXW63_28510 [Bacillus mycoides]
MINYSSNWEVYLTEEEKKQLKHLINELPLLDITKMDDKLLNELDIIKSKLPIRILKELVTFKRFSNLFGTLKFSNLPTDPILPNTPVKGQLSEDKQTAISEYILFLFMLCLGEPLAYEDEKQGLLVQNICPVKGQEKKQENTGSDILEFHTEDGFHPYKPDFLALYCVKSDKEAKAKTITSSIRKVLFNLSNDVIEILRKPLYKINAPSSFLENGDEDSYHTTIPVLSGPLLDPDICMDFYLMEPQTPMAKWALEYLKKQLLENCIQVALKPGELLVVDNKKAIHARTGFTPKYDGNDRWLQRMFAVRNIKTSELSRHPGKLVCSPVNVLFEFNENAKEVL